MLGRGSSFREVNSVFQKRLANEVKKIKKTSKILIKVDKTGSIYLMSSKVYEKKMSVEVTKFYKNYIEKINKEAKNITAKRNIVERVFRIIHHFA